MKPIKWILLVAFLGLVFGQMASALEIGPFCAEFENKSTDWTVTKSVPKFDPNLGTLIAVRVTGEACGYQTFRIDSEDTENQTFEVRTSGDIITDMPVGEDFIVYLPPGGEERVRSEELDKDEPFENPDPDYLGPDSYSDFIFDCDSDEKIYDDPLEVAAWVGPGNQDIKTTADATTNHHASGAYDTSIRTSVHAKICVYYECIPYLCIKGSKINDCDGSGIPGWWITLKDSTGAVIDKKQTDVNGEYSFCRLAPGRYKVCEEDKAGWVHVPPASPSCKDVILVEDDVEGVDFHNMPLLCISGHKYNSKTGDGISDWWITLYDENRIELQKKKTVTGGYYEFCGLKSGNYEVCEELRTGWKRIGPECIDVKLECTNSLDNDFENEPIINPPCGSGCPWFIKNELYTASSGEVKFVDASKGILANDPDGTIVVDPESITIDPKYGTIEVYEDGSFEYNPTGATGLYSGVYVIFKYKANNGLCDAKYLGIAKIQVR